MRAILLAAGLGTRLRPLSLELPKPAMPLGLHTLGGATLRSLADAGFREIALNAHHLPRRLEAALRRDLEGMQDDLALRFFYERELLGTGGGVRNIASALGADDYLIMNGDSLYLPDLKAAIRAHQEADAFATLLLRRPDGSALNSIFIDSNGSVRGILHGGDPSPRTHAFTGTQIVSARALGSLPPRGCIVRDMYVPALERGETLLGHVDDARFRDLGTVESYYDAHFEGRAPAVHPSAQVGEGALIENSWIGEGAEIASGAAVIDSIVWPGAILEGGELRRSILTRALRVER